MTDWLQHPDVTANPDGTYVINGEGADHPWVVYPWGGDNGWRASSANDNFGKTRFATAADAIGAVLGDPAESTVVGGRKLTWDDTGLTPRRR